jgi:cytidylate kinase
MQQNSQNLVITIGRQFGSGGRELGRQIAEKLGIAFYDKELLLQAAKNAGVSVDFFERNDEKFPKFLSGLFSFTMGYSPYNAYAGSSLISDENLYQVQSDLIRSLAQQSPCVIVGRSADYVLRDFPRCVNIFVHAPIEARVERIMRRGDCPTPEKARELAEKTNKLRAHYYDFYTDKTWGDAASYDLTVDSASMPIDRVADLVCAYVRARFPELGY